MRSLPIIPGHRSSFCLRYSKSWKPFWLKFTKALGFRSSQYIETSWDDDVNSTRKPETIEFRFRSVSGSDQVLVQKDTDWAIKLKDNGSNDNKGTVSFMLSGSSGYKEISSSLLPV